MADIALLEVEEFERRRKWAKEDGLEDLHRAALSALAAAGNKARETAAALARAEAVRRALQHPTTALGLAAADGLFSA